MKKKYRTSGARRKPAARGRTSTRGRGRNSDAEQDPGPSIEVQLVVQREEVMTLIRQSLHSFALEIGCLMAGRLLEEEISQLCGQKHQRQASRQAARHGRQKGLITMGGQRVRLERPRARYTDGGGEVPLETYALLQDPHAMPDAVLRRMVRGVSCRDYEQVVDLACAGFGVKKSSVSRHFVRASADSLQQLAARRLDAVRYAAIFIDGVEYAGETVVCAMGLTEDGQKQVLGLRQGATENAEVVASLLEELRDRGLDVSRPTLFVLDGAKALRAAVRRLWGKRAVVQRCQVHKKRNVQAHLAAKHWPELSRQLHAAYHEDDYDRALKVLRTTARWLDRINPDAAASLREGLEETLTVVRLGVPELLRKSVATTNPIESAFDTAKTVTSRVKRWRDGDMRKRWCAAGLLKAESRFKRVKGYRQIPLLVAALDTPSLDPAKKAG